MRLKPLDIAKVVVSAGMIAYLIWRVDMVAVLFALRHADYALLALSLLLYFIAIGLNVRKWSVLLAAQGERVPYRNLLAFSLTGLFFGNFLPTNVGGDLVRGYDLAKHLRRAEDAAVSVLMDRLVGLLAFITMSAGTAALAVLSWHRSDLLPLGVVVWTACAAAIAGIAAVLSRRLRRLMTRMLSLGPLQRLLPLWQRLSATLQSYRDHPGALARAYAVGMSVIVASNLVNYGIARAVGAGIPLRYIFHF